MALRLAQSTLYQMYASQSISSGDILLAPTPDDDVSRSGPCTVFACREIKPGASVLLPFSSNIVGSDETRPAAAAPIEDDH